MSSATRTIKSNNAPHCGIHADSPPCSTHWLRNLQNLFHIQPFQIFTFKSSGSSNHGGDGGGVGTGAAKDDEEAATVGIGGSNWIISSLDSDFAPLLNNYKIN